MVVIWASGHESRPFGEQGEEFSRHHNSGGYATSVPAAPRGVSVGRPPAATLAAPAASVPAASRGDPGRVNITNVYNLV